MSATQIDLPLAPATSAGRPRLDRRERDRLIRRAKALSWLSLAYMTAEGAIAITAALLAGSVALLGFGLDSAIEALASVIVSGASPAPADAHKTPNDAHNGWSRSASSCSPPTSRKTRSAP